MLVFVYSSSKAVGDPSVEDCPAYIACYVGGVVGHEILRSQSLSQNDGAGLLTKSTKNRLNSLEELFGGDFYAFGEAASGEDDVFV